MKKMQRRGLSIYVHWPFCKSICPYCDFNRYKRDVIDHEGMNKTYSRIFSHAKSQMKSLWPYTHVESVFFGGGTPSTASPHVFEHIIQQVYELNESFSQPNTHIEVTMEANPTSIETDKLKQFRDAGVNRVSIGVQSLNANDLKFLGRQHSVLEAKRAIDVAQDLFHDRVSIDLMFGTPQHASNELVWSNVLSEALDLGTKHISLYQLTVEKHTQFYKKWKSGEFALPDEETSSRLYETTINQCAQKGLHQYETSNFAASGSECKHNLQYWKSGDYLGIGPGAHSRLTTNNNQRISMVQIMRPEDWIHSVQSDHSLDDVRERRDIQLLGNIKTELLTSDQRLEELFMMGLRLVREGVVEEELDFHTGLTGTTFESIMNRNILVELQRNDFIRIETDSSGKRRIRTTSKGVPVLDELLGTMLASK